MYSRHHCTASINVRLAQQRKSAEHLARGLAVLPALVALLVLTGSAQAYDLSRIPDEQGKPGRGETVFVDGMFGVWLPGPSTFDANHTVSLLFGAEVGVTFLRLSGHQLLAVGALTYSPQTLEPHLLEARSDMIQGMGGVRWVPGVTCIGNDAGCAFLEVSLGLTWESVEPNGQHNAPQGALTVNLGAGYRFNLGDNFHIGGRVDMGYLEENSARQIGWLTPTLIAGASF